MAEVVDEVVEGLVPFFEDLRKRELFTEAELKALARQFRHHEYQIRRRAADVLDFVRYVQFALNVERMRRVRKRKLGVTSRRALSDFAGMRHTIFIFDRAVRRFRADLALWRQYIEFCRKSKSHRLMGRVLARCVVANPTADSMWVLAADFEFTHNHNIAAARVLLQRALRVNPNSRLVFVEYFHLELLAAIQIRERNRFVRTIKGDAAPAVDADAAARVAPLIDVAELPDAPDAAPSRPSLSDGEIAQLAELSLPLTVFKHGAQVLVGDFEFVTACVDLLGRFPRTDAASQLIWAHVANAWQPTSVPRAMACQRFLWNELHRAVRPTLDETELVQGVERCLAAFRALRAKVGEQCAALFDAMLDFVLRLRRLMSGFDEALQRGVLQLCDTMMREVDLYRFATPDKALELSAALGAPVLAAQPQADSSAITAATLRAVQLAVQTTAPNAAAEIGHAAAFAASRAHATSVAALLAQVARDAGAAASPSEPPFFGALQRVARAVTEDAHLAHVERVEQRARLTSLCAAAVSLAATTASAASTRACYRAIIARFTGSLDAGLFHVCLDFEESCVTPDVGAMRELCTRATTSLPHVTDLWLRAIAFELRLGELARASALYNEAASKVADQGNLTSRFHALQRS